MFLLAQPTPEPVFFPPWYFWLFVFAVVLVVFGAIATMVVVNIQAEKERQIRERELAAELIQVLLERHKLSADEVEQILSAYWRLGTFWSRFQQLWNRFAPRTKPTTPVWPEPLAGKR